MRGPYITSTGSGTYVSQYAGDPTVALLVELGIRAYGELAAENQRGWKSPNPYDSRYREIPEHQAAAMRRRSVKRRARIAGWS